MTDLEPAQVVRAAIGRVVDRDPATVTPELRLVEDLAVDSLALVEIAELIEERVRGPRPGFAITDDQLDTLGRVADVIALVAAACAVR